MCNWSAVPYLSLNFINLVSFTPKALTIRFLLEIIIRISGWVPPPIKLQGQHALVPKIIRNAFFVLLRGLGIQSGSLSPFASFEHKLLIIYKCHYKCEYWIRLVQSYHRHTWDGVYK